MVVKTQLNGISVKLDVRADGIRGAKKFREDVLSSCTSALRRKTARKKLDAIINGLRVS